MKCRCNNNLFQKSERSPFRWRNGQKCRPWPAPRSSRAAAESPVRTSQAQSGPGPVVTRTLPRHGPGPVHAEGPSAGPESAARARARHVEKPPEPKSNLNLQIGLTGAPISTLFQRRPSEGDGKCDFESSLSQH